MQIGKNKVVSIDYTLTNDAGQVIDSSKGRQPLVYLHGVGQIIPGLETALEGKSTGESVNVIVPARDGYGERDDKLVQAVPRQMFRGLDQAQIQPGMQFQAQTPQGARVVTVVKVDADQITIDANHPLAGLALNFDVTIADVRDASEEEISHGHAHGPGGHHH